MLSSVRGKLSLMFILLVAVIGGLLLFHLSAQAQPTKKTPAVTVTQPSRKTEIGIPVKLKVPTIGIDAPINAVGVSSNGDMEAPKGAKDTGWYKLGTRPGNIGSAVIAGHYGRWKNGDTSVFDKLNALAKGDKIYIQDDKGATITFIVQELRLLKRKDDSRSVFVSADGKAHLNLITCQGTWSESEKTYSNRLVVFADLQ